jgi:hypothetical protein
MSNTSLLGSYGGLGESSLMFRNRVINGDMRIDQRATATGAHAAFTVDRWAVNKSDDATVTWAQNTDAPSSFGYSLRQTITTADVSIGAAQYNGIEHRVEGFNIADFAWGTAAAKPVALSFWVRSSVTGQYTGNVRNKDDSRICPFNYSISAANTWEFKTVTIPGCPDGTWFTNNDVGLRLQLYAALGTNYLGGVDGTWNSTTKYGCGSPVNGLNANGNIFAITGVQLEAGASATPFERRPIGMELALCQRYYVAGNASTSAHCYATNSWMLPRISFPVEMRVTPTTITFTATTSGIAGTPAANNADSKGTRATLGATGTAPQNSFVDTTYIASAEL